MSLRKSMHPRNPYKKIPDFKQLALLHPSFCNVANIDLTGKVKIDFKNEESLRVLTEVLLKQDFNLEVQIPPNKLVPALPLRLNYVLWIEDLIKHSSFYEIKEIIGIDIGTGAVCIYPLLFAKMYGNQMIGTEIDETSIQTAIQQVENNNLQHLIKVLKVNGQTIFKNVVKDGETYHFTMCNPPFFEKERSERIIKCLPPRNAPTGNEAELTTRGGEKAFVIQMINESLEIKDKIKIYTTMFGRRSNLLILMKLLKRRKIENTTWTEFCQGHTKRWGLAWSFLPKDIINLTTAPVIRKSGDYIVKLLKEKRPIEIQFPMQDKFSSFDNLISFLEESMEELHIHIKELNLPIDDFNGWSCQLVTENDSWSHARRKRRLAQRQMNQCKRNINSNTNCAEQNTVEELNQSDSKITSDQICNQNYSHITNPFLVCNFFVELVEHEEDSKKDSVRISMIFEKGSGGKNALGTFKQYLINKLNIRDHFQKQHTALQRKKRKSLKKNESITSDNDMNQSRSSQKQNEESC